MIAAMKNYVQRPCRQSGFGLPEIMVGLVIGLIATLVIVQVVTTFEGQKRITSGGADAQTNGSIALYTIQRQAQMAGYGMPIFSDLNTPLNCDISTSYAGAPAMGLFPIVITNGGAAAGASDTILVRTDNAAIDSMGGTPILVTGITGVPNSVQVTNNMGCKVNDIAVISNGTSCQMRLVTALSVPPSYTDIVLQSNAGIGVSASIGCMSGWSEITYAVANDNLTERVISIAAPAAVATPAVAGIVAIKAQYGISIAGNDNSVVQWVDAVGAFANVPGTTPTVPNRNRIKAVRIAVIARDGGLQKTAVTQQCSSTTAAAPTGLCAWAGSVASPAPTVLLANLPDGTNWNRYRYRVFETIVPLRNILWNGKNLL